MQVFAPAKINLSLKILGARDDGFHEIETLIAPISICDEIRIEKHNSGKGVEFYCDDPSVPIGDDNLAVRAAKFFFAGTKLEPAISIELKKKIPHGAGLGGHGLHGRWCPARAGPVSAPGRHRTGWGRER